MEKSWTFTNAAVTATLTYCSKAHSLDIEAAPKIGLSSSGEATSYKERFNNIGSQDPVEFFLKCNMDGDYVDTAKAVFTSFRGPSDFPFRSSECRFQ